MASQDDKQLDNNLKIRTLLQKPDSKTATTSSSEEMPSDMLTFLPASDIGVPKNRLGKTPGKRLQTLVNRIANSLATLGKRIHSTSNAGLLSVQRHVNHVATLVALIPLPKITIKPTVYQCSSWVALIEHFPARTNTLATGIHALKTKYFPAATVRLHQLKNSLILRAERIYKAYGNLKNRIVLEIVRKLLLIINWTSRTSKRIAFNLNTMTASVRAIQTPKMNANPSVFSHSNWIELFEHIPENTNVLTPWLSTLKARLLPTITSYVNYMKVTASTRITNVSKLLEDQNNRRLLDLSSIFLTVVLLILLWAGRTQLGF